MKLRIVYILPISGGTKKLKGNGWIGEEEGSLFKRTTFRNYPVSAVRQAASVYNENVLVSPSRG